MDYNKLLQFASQFENLTKNAQQTHPITNVTIVEALKGSGLLISETKNQLDMPNPLVEVIMNAKKAFDEATKDMDAAGAKLQRFNESRPEATPRNIKIQKRLQREFSIAEDKYGKSGGIYQVEINIDMNGQVKVMLSDSLRPLPLFQQYAKRVTVALNNYLVHFSNPESNILMMLNPNIVLETIG